MVRIGADWRDSCNVHCTETINSLIAGKIFGDEKYTSCSRNQPGNK